MSLVARTIALVLLCSTSVVSAQYEEPPPEYWIYTVRPGDNAWALARRLLTKPEEWGIVARGSRLSAAAPLRPGQQLRIPFALSKTQLAPVVVVAARDARLFRRGTTESAVLAGAQLVIGDRVRTGPGGSATFRFADSSQLVMEHDSVVAFDTLSEYGATGMVDSRTHIEQGRVRVDRGPSHGARFRVLTPAGNASARGTGFRVDFEPAASRGHVETFEGTVVVAGGGREVSVAAGLGTVQAVGQPPSPPTPLLPAPGVGSSAQIASRLPVRVAVSPVTGASEYRLDLSSSLTFEWIDRQGSAREPEFRVTELDDGTYAFRVRAVDAQGLEGLDATGALVVDARPDPPVLLAPVPDAVVRDERPVLRWAEVTGATAYAIELLQGEGVTPIVRTTIGASPRFSIADALPPGRYRWRVASIVGADRGPFGDLQTFERRDGRGAGTPGADVESARAVFRWAAGLQSDRYHFQLSRDPSFAVTVADLTVDAPQTTLAPPPPPGEYYLRVRVVEPDGYEGPWSSVQAFRIEAPPRKPRRWPWVVVAGAAAGVLVAVTR